MVIQKDLQQHRKARLHNECVKVTIRGQVTLVLWWVQPPLLDENLKFVLLAEVQFRKYYIYFFFKAIYDNQTNNNQSTQNKQKKLLKQWFKMTKVEFFSTVMETNPLKHFQEEISS